VGWASSASGLEVAKAATGYKVGESQGSYKTYSTLKQAGLKGAGKDA